ncbi:hypothetical protein KGP26_00845 [Serratia sp. JSRIV002]|uniref:hypothetical protein n=1 Tax=unclassified Serratia (in: enterobacteria) TaxID=2647522 RepID=UPI0019DD1EFD|nr:MULTISPECIES: hypothetical protein [unclassified Serratia (in: enterobacteria)]MBE0152801.1 hypothetical protein [Serratia fonticola]UAN51677.1 hypothetical protein KGP26_00845 [Serratia sp. JSRIV002]
MDIYVDLFLPKGNDVCHLKEDLISWGGESFSQSPKKYSWMDTLKFASPEHSPSYEILLPQNVELDNYSIYSIDDNSIYEWEQDVNNHLVSNNYLKKFITDELPNIDSWIAAISFDEDIIDNIKKVIFINNVNELIEEIEKAMNWNDTNGFIAYKI